MNRAVLAALTLALVACGGCRLGALFLAEPTRTEPAEYPWLKGKRVAVVVRAPDEILFEYPYVRLDVGDHVRAALEAGVQQVDVVPTRQVVEFQQTERDWETLDPAVVGRRFSAQRVVEIDLTQYTTREPESPHLYRGYIWAAVRVYNVDYPGSEPAKQWSIQTVYPPDGPGQWGTSDDDIRRATMATFAGEVAAKFYDRKVKVR